MSRIVDECQDQTLEQIIHLVESGVVNLNTTPYDWSRILGNRGISTPLLVDFVDSWQTSKLPNDGLAFGFRVALQAKRRIVQRAPEIELVWTGPYPPSSGFVRSTFAVMPEMLANAKRSILLVGYSLTSSTSYPAAIIEQLAVAKQRGCDVKLALHDDGHNYRRLRQAWPRHLPLPTLLRWVGNEEDTMASLHAKILLIDRKELFVTSANLTHHGLSSNIEVGVRIKGNVADQMANHFLSLERAGILQRIERIR